MAMVSELLSFLLAFAGTLAGVAMTAGLGLRGGHRRLHVASAALTAAVFVVAVYLAEMLGRVLAIPRGILAVHLVFANAATAALVAVVVTGVSLWRRDLPTRRRRHRRLVVTFVVLVVVATGTGTWMVMSSSPRSPTSRIR